MKKVFGILLLSIYLIPSLQLYQFLKVPNLLEHYQHHVQVNPALSFTDFLSLHYFNGDVKDADYQQDMKLPFKKAELANAVTSLAFFIPEPLETPQFIRNSIESVVGSHHQLNVKPYFSGIWQPPQRV